MLVLEGGLPNNQHSLQTGVQRKQLKVKLMNLILVYNFLPALLPPQNHCTALPPQSAPSSNISSASSSQSPPVIFSWLLRCIHCPRIIAARHPIDRQSYPPSFNIRDVSHRVYPPPPRPSPTFPLHRCRRCPTSVPHCATSSNARRRNASCSSIRTTHVPFE
jgi:hypothetical protein